MGNMHSSSGGGGINGQPSSQDRKATDKQASKQTNNIHPAYIQYRTMAGKQASKQTHIYAPIMLPSFLIVS